MNELQLFQRTDVSFRHSQHSTFFGCAVRRVTRDKSLQRSRDYLFTFGFLAVIIQNMLYTYYIKLVMECNQVHLPKYCTYLRYQYFT